MPTAYERAYTIFQTFIFSSYLKKAADNRKIPEDWFNPNPEFESFGDDIRLLNRRDLNSWTQNLNTLIKGMCFIAFDEALDNIYKEDKKLLPESYQKFQQGTLRVIIYMFRCAIAHNPANPVWQVQGKYKDIKELEIPEIGFKINISNLDQKPLNSNQYGGADKLSNLMKFCLSLIEERDYDLSNESA